MKVFVESHVEEERLAICRSCDQLSEYNICKKCGCFMLMKVKVAQAKCPMEKWLKSDDTQ